MKQHPIAYSRIDVTTFYPADPANPDGGGDQSRADPIMIEIYPHANVDHLPQGILGYVRKLLLGVVRHARTYTPTPVGHNALAAPANVAAKPFIPPVASNENPAPAKSDAPAALNFHSVPEDEQICARCGWVESQCGCEAGFLAPETEAV